MKVLFTTDLALINANLSGEESETMCDSTRWYSLRTSLPVCHLFESCVLIVSCGFLKFGHQFLEQRLLKLLELLVQPCLD